MEERGDQPSAYWRPAVFALPASEEWRAGLLEAAAAAEAAGEAAGELKDRARWAVLLPAVLLDEAAAAAAWF